MPDRPRPRVTRQPQPDATPSVRESLPELRSRLGARVRAARLERGISTRALAAATGLSAGFVSQLENGHVMPSVGSLVAVAQKLGIHVGDLFATTPPAAHGVLRLADRVAYLANPGVRDEVVSLDPTERLEVVIGVIQPGAGSGDELYTHGADVELVLVLRGAIDVFLGEETVSLGPGDALTFAGDVPHGYLNRGPDEVELVWVMTPATY